MLNMRLLSNQAGDDTSQCLDQASKVIQSVKGSLLKKISILQQENKPKGDSLDSKVFFTFILT